VCYAPSKFFLVYVSRWNRAIFWPSVLHVALYKFSSIFDLGPLTPKIYFPKLLAITLDYHVATPPPPVVALSARQLCLGKVGNPLNFRADPCCHGNEIWARRGDPVAYRLVYSANE